MLAVEFQTTVKNGTIEIPPEHRTRFKHRVRVILLAEETSRAAPNLIDQLLARPLRIADFHPMTREETHAR